MAVNLSPFGGVGVQFFDNSGNPLTGGKIFTYTAGTTTPQTTYTSSSGAVAHSNPIILDAAGRVPSGGEIWLTDGLQYKFLLKDANDVQIASYDNVIGLNSNFVAFTNSQEIQTATAGQTVFTLTTMQYQPGTNSLSVFVDGVNQYGPGAQYAYVETNGTTVTFTNGLHVGAEVKFTTSQLNTSGAVDASQVSYDPPFTGGVVTNVEDKLAQTVSVKDFGAVGDGVADDTAAIQAAIAASDSIYFPEGTYLVSETIYTRGTFDGVHYRGKKLFGAGIEATTIKAAAGFTDNFVIFIGNQDYISNVNPVFCIQNQLSDMTIEHENIPDTANNAGVYCYGTWNNRLSNLKIGVIALPATRWDLSIANGTYTTTVDVLHCQNLQIASSVVGDVTTIWLYGVTATFVNLVNSLAIGFDHLTVQGKYSTVYQYNRIQITLCANVSFHNGDLEGDGRMFTIANSQGIQIVNNNVALPGSFTKSGVDQQSIFMTADNCVGILSRDNVFMNWQQGPLGVGIYLDEPGSPNRNMQTCDFNGAYFTGASYYKNSSSVIPASTPTIVNFADLKYDSGTYTISSFATTLFSYTPLVTTGATWKFTAPLRAYYSVKAALVLTGLNTASETAFIAVYVAGFEVWRKWNTQTNASGQTILDINTDVYADVTQDIQIIVWHNGAGVVSIPTIATTNFVQISLINER